MCGSWSCGARRMRANTADSHRLHRFCLIRFDHIIGKQHRGSDDAANLCLCCIRCNLNKGPNIASIDPETGLLVALYHPRFNAWREHFAITTDGLIKGLTAEGRATVLVLAMNEEDRVRLRELLIRRSRYP